jgi:hypothetical protein
MSSKFDLFSLQTSTLPPTSSAIYACNMTNMWTMARHPMEYPSSSTHWTAPVLVTHNTSYVMWAPGSFTSAAAEPFAEVCRQQSSACENWQKLPYQLSPLLRKACNLVPVACISLAMHSLTCHSLEKLLKCWRKLPHHYIPVSGS